jgi:hypothetical protein
VLAPHDIAASKFTRLCVTRQPCWSLFNIFHKECGDCSAQYDTNSFVWRMECFTKCSKYWAAHITMRYNVSWYCTTKRVHRKAPLVYLTNIWVGYNWIISNCIRKARSIHTRVTWRIGVGAPRHRGTKDLKIVCNTAAMLITSELIPFRVWYLQCSIRLECLCMTYEVFHKMLQVLSFPHYVEVQPLGDIE